MAPVSIRSIEKKALL